MFKQLKYSDKRSCTVNIFCFWFTSTLRTFSVFLLCFNKKMFYTNDITLVWINRRIQVQFGVLARLNFINPVVDGKYEFIKPYRNLRFYEPVIILDFNLMYLIFWFLFTKFKIRHVFANRPTSTQLYLFTYKWTNILIICNRWYLIL